MGITVRGMEFALASGIMAAETIIEAKKKGDYSAGILSSYEKRLKEGFVLQDLYAARKMPAFLANEDLFSFYPKTIPQLIERVIWFGNAPKGPLGRTIWDGLKSSSMLKFRRLKDIYRLKDI
jgi:electron transfer flavoprotein-quinone oxidoreductase